MENQIADPNTGEILTMEQLLEAYERAKEATAQARQAEDRYKLAILAQMRLNDATAIPSETYICQSKPNPSKPDQTRLRALFEEMNEQDLAHCYRQEVIKEVVEPAHFKTTETKAACMRNGGRQKQIYESAVIQGEPTLIFKRRETKEQDDA